MDKNEIEKIEIELFVDAVYKRYGYDFRHYARASIRRRVRRLVEKTDHQSISAMIPKLLYDESFFESIVYDFSTTVTEMFRDPTFYRAIREKVVPYLKTYPFIKIWHAGCATGEEVYSLAIVLQEEGLYNRSTIFATDFNDVALEKAKEGIYSLANMQQYTSNYQKGGGKSDFSKYYQASYDSVIMDQSLRENITFANHNLVTDSVFSETHLILCRNVLIYFDSELQNRVLALFNDSLAYGGFLCLGSKESIHFSDIRDRFKGIDKQERIYQKSAV